MTRRLIIVAFATLAACRSHETIDCTTNDDCLQGGIPGVCMPSPIDDSVENWCAFSDTSCPGGLRWGILSGDGIASICLAADGDAGPLDAGIDATVPPPLSTRIFIDDGNSGMYVYDATDLSAIGSITLPPLGGYNLGMSVTRDTAYMVRGGDSYVVVGVNPVTNVVRAGFPKTITACTPRFVGAEGLYCISGAMLQLYDGDNYTALKHAYTSPTADLPLPQVFDDGLMLVLVGKTTHVLDAQLTEVGAGIVSSTSPHVFAVSKGLGRLAIADNNSVRLYDLTTRNAVGAVLTFTPTVFGLVFDSQKLVITLSDSTITAYSVDGAGTQLIAPVPRGGTSMVYDVSRDRIVLLKSGNIEVLDAPTLQNVAGSPVTLPTGGAGVRVF